jgi:uncharacterized protein YdeI (YjbR/CyaY-like superfamily)
VTAHPDVDAYIERSEQWPAEVAALRPILLGCGLSEQIKWNKPCYGHDGRNIAIIQEMKDFVALMFFKGALIDDRAGLLEEQGPNSRSARRLVFTSADAVAASADTIRAYVADAIAVEEAGLEVPAPEVVFVDELQQRLDRDPALKEAFESLTPGRQREYDLHIGGAKQVKTRIARMERCVDRILAGKGLRR